MDDSPFTLIVALWLAFFTLAGIVTETWALIVVALIPLATMFAVIFLAWYINCLLIVVRFLFDKDGNPR